MARILMYNYSKPCIQHSLTCTKTASQFAPCCANVNSESVHSCWVKVSITTSESVVLTVLTALPHAQLEVKKVDISQSAQETLLPN